MRPSVPVTAAVCLLLVLLSALSSTLPAASVTNFEGGVPAVSITAGPGANNTTAVVLRSGASILSAAVNVTWAPDGNGTPPTDPRLDVGADGSVEWGVQSSVFGGLGRQDRFVGGQPLVSAGVVAGLPVEPGAIRFPWNATINSADLAIAASATDRPAAARTLASPGNASQGATGHAVSSGDFNGDGWDDFAILTGDANQSRVEIFLGGAAPDLAVDAAIILTAGLDIGNVSPRQIAFLPDVDGDSRDELLVGVPLEGGGAAPPGAAYLIRGNATPPAALPLSSATFEVHGNSTSGRLGYEVAAVGDAVGGPGGDFAVAVPATALVDGAIALIYSGAAPVNASPSATVTHQIASPGFVHIAPAGDVNGDARADVLVSASTGVRAGLFYGPVTGARSLGSPNLSIPISAFGPAIAAGGLGDLQGDGFDDWIFPSGADLFVYRGSPFPDAIPDHQLRRQQGFNFTAASIAGPAELTGDAFDDLVVGIGGGGNGSGRALIIAGQPGLPASLDPDQANLEVQGGVLSSGGSVAVGRFGPGPGLDIATAGDGGAVPCAGCGRANLTTVRPSMLGLLDFELRPVGGPVTFASPVFTGTYSVSFAIELRPAVAAAAAAGSDSFGNVYLEVPLEVRANSAGTVTFVAVLIRYAGMFQVAGLAAAFQGALDSASVPAGADVPVPLRVVSGGAGTFTLHDLRIETDDPPALAMPIPVAKVPEDTLAIPVDLSAHFIDDKDSNLTFSVVRQTEAGRVNAFISGGRFLALDAELPAAAENWTGSLVVTVRAADSRPVGIEVDVSVLVTPVPDAPIFLNAPPTAIRVGIPWSWSPQTRDGDGDNVTVRLKDGPAAMVLAANGTLTWDATEGDLGSHPATFEATDGNLTATLSATLVVLEGPGINHPPAITSAAPRQAVPGTPYTYAVVATDPDDDPLVFRLDKRPVGMTINSSGVITWTPTRADAGEAEVLVVVSDGAKEANQSWTITVLRLPPVITVLFTSPANGSTVAGTLQVNGTASWDDGGIRRVELRVDRGVWRAADLVAASDSATWSVTIDTTTLSDGPHELESRAVVRVDTAEISGYATRNVTIANNDAPCLAPPCGPVDRNPFANFLVIAAIAVVVAIVAGLLATRAMMRRPPPAAGGKARRATGRHSAMTEDRADRSSEE